jgi:hypothetical protein
MSQSAFLKINQLFNVEMPNSFRVLHVIGTLRFQVLNYFQNISYS